MSRPVAVRTGLQTALQQPGADALPRHFQEAEWRYAPDLDARPVVLERFLEPLLNRTVVAVLLHIDEVDDD